MAWKYKGMEVYGKKNPSVVRLRIMSLLRLYSRLHPFHYYITLVFTLLLLLPSSGFLNVTELVTFFRGK